MIEGSARARFNRTLNTKTTMSSVRLNLRLGDEVEFYRDTGTKDTPGWHGPAEVIDVSRAGRNVVTIRWMNRPLEVQLQNIRRHLHYLVYFQELTWSSSWVSNPHIRAFSHIRAAMERISPGRH